MGKTRKRYPVEVRERAVRLMRENRDSYETEWAAMRSIAQKFGCAPETLRKWVRRAERDAGERPGVTTAEQKRVKELERENRELRRRQRDPAKGVGVFCPGGARPPTQVMVSFIDDPSTRLRGRADLRSAADRPVDVLPAPPSTPGSGAATAARKARRGAAARDPTGVDGELRPLRGAEGLATAAARGR